MDVLTPEQRKRNMQSIRGKDTKIEVKVRSELFKRGSGFEKTTAVIRASLILFFPNIRRLSL